MAGQSSQVKMPRKAPVLSQKSGNLDSRKNNLLCRVDYIDQWKRLKK